MKILRFLSTIVAVALGMAGIALVLYAWRLPPFTTSVEMTDNAYVRGQVTILAPQLAGYLAEVNVQDYQEVKAGQVLVTLDDRIYRQKLEQANAALAGQKAALANSEQDKLSAEAKIRARQAQLDGAKVALDNAEANWKRMEPLLTGGVVTVSDAEKTRLALDQARSAQMQAQAALDVSQQALQATIVGRQSLEAAVQGAEASVHLAQIDLQNTKITAPVDGRLGEVGARLGQYVAAGTQLVAIVPHAKWVVANFKETQLPGIRIGQPVTMKIDALSHAEIKGTVERFAPAAGSEFSVLKPDNATGNFTKVAQRIPLRIRIDDGQALSDQLVPGMSVVVTLDTASEPRETTAALE